MIPLKPAKTPADFLVISLSPGLIMLLVGSLNFFLIEVFFRGEAVDSVRWVMFWFVLAVVLVSRIGIEHGTRSAAGYGLALAAATWLYLVRVHPAFLLGALLLGLVWWCAHKLTWDCTLIDEDEDASGAGLLETVDRQDARPASKPDAARDWKRFLVFRKQAANPPDPKVKPKPAAPHPPGLWVVWFSLAALPLFGIGQKLLPAGDQAARRAGFTYLLIYVAAALGLLLTTSFLGLRRYLRQRRLVMPGLMAFGWMRFGTGVAALVLIGALLLPRPGALEAWQTLGYHINHQLRQASEYAARFGPHGAGRGRAGNEPDNSAPEQNATAPSGAEKTPGQSPDSAATQTAPNQAAPPHPAALQLYKWFKALFLLGLALLAGWWLFRNRTWLFAMAQSCLAALLQFFQDLFQWGSPPDGTTPAAAKSKSKRRRFAAYPNPFLTGKDSTWTVEQLVLYSYEALRAWAEEQGVPPRPEQTAREFCADLGGRFPEVTAELDRLSFLYSHAAYGMTAPAGCDVEPVRKLWRFLG
jgi:hypothetical protein